LGEDRTVFSLLHGRIARKKDTALPKKADYNDASKTPMDETKGILSPLRPIQKVRPMPLWLGLALFAGATIFGNLPNEWILVDTIGKILFLLASATMIHTLSYKWGISPVFFGKIGLLFVCSSCVLPFLLLPLVWLIPWKILFGIVIVSSISYIVLGFIGAAKFENIMDAMGQAISQKGYPYDFYVTISRRFTSPTSVAIFENVVLPQISEQGEILECWYASDSHEDPDYWIARMDILFSLADIHLLLDIDGSPATHLEVKMSHKRAMRPNTLYLNLIFPEDHGIHKATSTPFCVHISKRGSASRINFGLRRASIRLRSEKDMAEFANRLRRIVNMIKATRLMGSKLLENDRNIANPSWYAPTTEGFMEFLEARREVARIFVPENREKLAQLLSKIDARKLKKIARINFLTKLTFEIESGERIRSFREIYVGVKSTLSIARDDIKEISARANFVVKVMINVIALLLALNLWLVSKFTQAKASGKSD
jgi:hypothetical protein